MYHYKVGTVFIQGNVYPSRLYLDYILKNTFILFQMMPVQSLQ